MSAHRLKNLQVLLVKANTELALATADYRTASAVLAQVTARRDQLQKDLDALKRPGKEPTVSEHALLRYVERIYGIDLENLRHAILIPSTLKAIQVAGSGTYPIEGGGRVVVKDNVIVSIVD